MRTIDLWCWAAIGLAGCATETPRSDSCGDGALDAYEACDDGNALGGDGCSSWCWQERGTGLADVVVEAPGASGTGFGDPARAINGVRGGGERMQSLDVFSIGIGPDEHLVLGWEGARIADGPGDDLVVFENAFAYGDERTFIDAAIVEVSADGQGWVALPHDYVAPDEREYSALREHWSGFAGVTPVLLHDEDNPLAPFDDAAGGDRFDLSDLPAGPEADSILANGARYVRIVAAASRENPDTGEPFVLDPVSDGPDIDGVAARYLAEEP